MKHFVVNITKIAKIKVSTGWYRVSHQKEKKVQLKIRKYSVNILKLQSWTKYLEQNREIE